MEEVEVIRGCGGEWGRWRGVEEVEVIGGCGGEWGSLKEVGEGKWEVEERRRRSET